MSGIRLTYAGLLALVIRLASVITGIIFTIIVTRNLTLEEFGLWRLIGGLISYVVIVEPVANYWVTRQIARGEEAGKTGIFTNGIFAAGASTAYIAMISFVSGATGSNYNLLLLSTILIPVTYISNTLEAINLGYKPQATSYGFIAFELAKIPMGLLLVEATRMGLAGAILATFVAFLARDFVLVYNAREKLRAKFSPALVKNWLRLSWLPLYNNIAGMILTLDVLLFSLIVGSVKPLAFYAAATAITAVIANSSGISQALYPKLLAENKKEYVEIALRRTFLFSIPILTAVIIYAKASLFILNPIYAAAVPVVYISAFTSLAYVISTIMYNVVGAIERVDINLNSRIMDYVKSRLFIIPTLTYIQYGSYIGLLVTMLFIIKPLILEDLQLIVLWVIIGLITQIPFTIYSWRLAVKSLSFKFPWISIGKYSLISGIAATIMLILNDHILIYNNSIYIFAPRLAATLSIAGGIYFSILYAIDADFRVLASAIVKELKGRTV